LGPFLVSITRHLKNTRARKSGSDLHDNDDSVPLEAFDLHAAKINENLLTVFSLKNFRTEYDRNHLFLGLQYWPPKWSAAPPV
jgi:hypothetical protein